MVINKKNFLENQNFSKFKLVGKSDKNSISHIFSSQNELDKLTIEEYKLRIIYYKADYDDPQFLKKLKNWAIVWNKLNPEYHRHI